MTSQEISETVKAKIRAVDFIFENSVVTMTANRNCQQIKLVGLSIGPFEEGNLYQVRYWVAKELSRSRIAVIKEGQMLDLKTLTQKHYRMHCQTSRTFIRLESFFYARVRRFLAQLQRRTSADARKREFEKAEEMVEDLIRNRRMKIINRFAHSSMTTEILEKLTPEERAFFESPKGSADSYVKAMLDPSVISDPRERPRASNEYLTVMTDVNTTALNRVHMSGLRF